MKTSRHYPKLGGDLAYGCQRLIESSGAGSAVVILYRGENEQTEVAMQLAPWLDIGAAAFRRLTDEILKDTYAASIGTANKVCKLLMTATSAECVILFLIEKDGALRVWVSQPKPNEFVASFALQIADSFDAMN